MERQGADIVVVEDDAELRETVVDYLQSKGLQTLGLADGSGLRGLFDCGPPPTIVLLDLDLPGESGLSLCRWLSLSTRASIILATSACDPLDRIIGIETGADAYAAKPYDLRALVASIRALMQRPRRESPRQPMLAAPPVQREVAPEEILSLGTYRLDRKARRMTNTEGCEIRLTGLEFSIALIFAERPGRLLPRAAIAELVKGRDAVQQDRAVDVAIARLRRKLDIDQNPQSLIATLRGEGYRYDPQAIELERHSTNG